MDITQAEELIAQAFKNASEEQFINQAEWLLNGWPILSGDLAQDSWSGIDGDP